MMAVKAAPCPAGGSGGGPGTAISGHGGGGNATGGADRGREGDDQCVVRIGSVDGHGQNHCYSKVPHESDSLRRSHPSFRRLPQQPIGTS